MFTAFVTKSLFPGTIKAVKIKHSLQVLYSYEISLKLVRSNVYQYHQKQQHSTHKNWTQTLNTGKSHSLPKHKINRQNPCHQHVMAHKSGKDFLSDPPPPPTTWNENSNPILNIHAIFYFSIQLSSSTRCSQYLHTELYGASWSTADRSGCSLPARSTWSVGP